MLTPWHYIQIGLALALLGGGLIAGASNGLLLFLGAAAAVLAAVMTSIGVVGAGVRLGLSDRPVSQIRSRNSSGT